MSWNELADELECAGRAVEPRGSEGRIRDRLGLRQHGFKGIDKSEFLHNRQVYGHAFELLEEGMAFLLRHLPIAGRGATWCLRRS
ncbi:MAG: hypothetical protein KAY24_13290 [Candidatus Eisenbacteria sp.]|nr:hypothetical protein [Candidatus Eisenbacteria bacterium]